MYTVLVRFISVRKTPYWKAEADRDCSKSIGISGKMEGENTMEKRLKVFRAHSRIFPWRSEAIELLNRCMVDTGYNVATYKDYSP